MCGRHDKHTSRQANRISGPHDVCASQQLLHGIAALRCAVAACSGALLIAMGGKRFMCGRAMGAFGEGGGGRAAFGAVGRQGGKGLTLCCDVKPASMSLQQLLKGRQARSH